MIKLFIINGKQIKYRNKFSEWCLSLRVSIYLVVGTYDMFFTFFKLSLSSITVIPT